MKVDDEVLAPYRGNWCKARVLEVTKTRVYVKLINQSGWAVTGWRKQSQVRPQRQEPGSKICEKDGRPCNTGAYCRLEGVYFSSWSEGCKHRVDRVLQGGDVKIMSIKPMVRIECIITGHVHLVRVGDPKYWKDGKLDGHYKIIADETDLL